MYRVTQAFHNRIYNGEIPSVYAVVVSDTGNHLFGMKPLEGAFITTPLTADGSSFANGLVDGSGNLCVVEMGDRLINPGILERSIQPRTRDVINSLTNKEKQNIMIELDNHDYSISKQLPKDPWLTKLLKIFVGFESDTLSDQTLLFLGRIYEIEVGKETILLSAQEL